MARTKDWEHRIRNETFLHRRNVRNEYVCSFAGLEIRIGRGGHADPDMRAVRFPEGSRGTTVGRIGQRERNVPDLVPCPRLGQGMGSYVDLGAFLATGSVTCTCWERSDFDYRQPHISKAVPGYLEWWEALEKNSQVGGENWISQTVDLFTDTSMRGRGSVWDGKVPVQGYFTE